MNNSMQVLGRIWRFGLVLAAGGTVLASSCTTTEIKTFIAGVEFATNQLSPGDAAASFVDLLSSEVEQ